MSELWRRGRRRRGDCQVALAAIASGRGAGLLGGCIGAVCLAGGVVASTQLRLLPGLALTCY
eukprot:3031636-Rhodomonas_salina.1